MFLVDGEWLDHGDPRVDALWTNRLIHRPPTADSLAACRAILGDEDEFYIEMAADYAEDAYGCLAARMAYGTPVVRRNLTHLNERDSS